ncbi:type II toxin-antitoxin system RelB/DinJ family antitoxin [Xylocopilactobacillus apicola]|uniref:DNA-damage-inducible protein J n=1 Tax=Xylocopilactobacillus apicola TaxID=2932184 RepID=A0AAU9D2J6_9LACO|nr:type II toxin-antitoxin system RelB/DinJ family antitoxin [Xylocopilactobacillus apicola]BDR57688.1 DNA-damage-inducible protein J [Xylocopilactobacillus apicola]
MDKKRIQIQVDKDLAEDTEQVLKELGLTPTTAITILYKQIVAKGALPFEIALTDAQKATLNFLKLTEDTPVTVFNNADEVAKWLNDPNED